MNFLSTRGWLNAKQPSLQGKRMLLTGLRVRDGNIVDAVAPIYTELLPDGQFGLSFEAPSAGGAGGVGGGERVVRLAGHYISALLVQRGQRDNAEVVASLRVTWSRFPRLPNPDALPATVTQAFGAARGATTTDKPMSLMASSGAAITDLLVRTARDGNGGTTLADLAITQSDAFAELLPPASRQVQAPVSATASSEPLRAASAQQRTVNPARALIDQLEQKIKQSTVPKK